MLIRVLRGIALMVVAIAAAVALGTLIPRPILGADDAGHAPTRTILVLANPIHTDIAIAIDDATRERFAFIEAAGLPAAHPEARWLVFGWGGRAFYLETPTWSELKPGPLFKALTVDRAVMHVAVAGAIDPSHPDVTAFQITGSGHERLLGFISASFSPRDGQPVHIAGAGYGDNDAFFEAEGRFNAVVGCNTWTARALREAGLTTGWWNPLPWTLAASLRAFN